MNEIILFDYWTTSPFKLVFAICLFMFIGFFVYNLTIKRLNKLDRKYHERVYFELRKIRTKDNCGNVYKP